MKKIHVSSLQFRPRGAQTIIFLGDISAVMGLKIEKVGPSFSTFNSCPSLSFIATGDRKQSQCLNKVLLHFSKTCKFWSSKANRHLHFSLPSIILADLLGRVSFIDLYLVFPRNFRMVFLPHTNTVILLEPYCGTITEPGLPMVRHTRCCQFWIFFQV